MTLPRDRLKRLIDAAAFRDVLQRRSADLVLYGHIHRASLAWLPGDIPAVSVPSASANLHGEAPAGYHLFAIDRDAGARWTCTMVTRGLAEDGATIREIARQTIWPRTR